MNTITAMLFVLSLVFGQQVQSQNGGWNGLVPLHSTRKDVERLLGRGGGVCHCEYRLREGNVSFQYSGQPCSEVKERGWRVPRDTVINVSFYPKASPRFSELTIDRTKYVKKADPEIKGAFGYFNENEGILIEVDGDTVSGFHYTPTRNDDYLRCSLKKKSSRVRNNSKRL